MERLKLTVGKSTNPMDWKESLISIWQERGMVKSLPAQGRSMYPLIKEGDTLYIKFCNSTKVKVGDIIAFRRRGATVVHRVIRRMDSGFLEKGDLQLRGEHIGSEKIMGKVVWEVCEGRVPDSEKYRASGKLGRSLMAFLGYIVHLLSPVRLLAKLLLLIPFVVNAGTRTLTKLC